MNSKLSINVNMAYCLLERRQKTVSVNRNCIDGGWRLVLLLRNKQNLTLILLRNKHKVVYEKNNFNFQTNNKTI